MNICRICLYSNPINDITQLTLQSHENDDKQSYEEIMEFCLGIQVTLKTQLCTKLCETCYSKIIEFYQFKALALRNDAHLRSVEFQTDVLLDDKIKKEEYISDEDVTENENYYQEDEPLVYVKEECKEELSEDDFLSVYKYNKENNMDKDDNIKDLVDEKPKEKGQSKRKSKESRLKSTPKKGPKSKKKVDVSTKPTKRVCDICGKEVIDLKQHQLRHLPVVDDKKTECEICGKTLSSVVSKRRHIDYKHLNVKTKCNICQKSVKDLSKHIKIMHQKESLPEECVVCRRRFLCKNKLSLHMVMHTKDRPFECDVCGKTFRAKVTMQLHKRQVHEKERSHMCQFCSKRFFKKDHLQIHIRTHTKENPYECPVCKKKFRNSYSLKTHSYLHRKEKNFKCTLCDNSFISPSYLRMHMRSHTKDKKYACQYCNVRFHRSDHRKRHEYTAHLKHAIINKTNDSSKEG